jgi:hypothetical protein
MPIFGCKTKKNTGFVIWPIKKLMAETMVLAMASSLYEEMDQNYPHYYKLIFMP